MPTIKELNKAFHRVIQEQQNNDPLPPKDEAIVVIQTFNAIHTIVSGMGNYIRDVDESPLDIHRLKQLINELSEIRDRVYRKVKWLQKNPSWWYKRVKPWQFNFILKELQKVHKDVLPNYQDLIEKTGDLDHEKFSELPDKVKKIEDALEEIRMKGFFDRVS